VQKPVAIDLGPYQLVERIGDGGSGQVYRARGPEGVVAVKLLGPASEMDDAARARFRREIGALGQIAHPNLVAMIDHGVDAELGPYLVLPLLAGTNLRALVGRAMCPEAALLVVQPIAHAAVALHAAGYVHRDLKPENVIAGPDGAITVIDLGLAWRDGMTRHTDTGTAVGSVGYMAPEQIEGRAVDARADVWALGVMIYELVAGKRPFARARPAEEAAAMLLGTCARLTAADRRCDDDLAELVARCLSIDPARRPAMTELAAAIDAMIDWTDDAGGERAAVVADPIAYQARVAPFRLRRIERLAREALDAGKPFVALALCDRGLAYVPDHAALLALVADAEATTGRVDSAVSPVATTTSRGAAVAAAPSQPARRIARRWPWVVGAVAFFVLGGLVVYWVVPEKEPAKPVEPASQINAEDRALISTFAGLFGRAMTKIEEEKGRPPAAMPRTRPTTASGWLDLAATQPPAEAVASVREALAISPSWLDAQIALCIALALADDDGAIGACDVAIERKPNDAASLAARGRAKLRAGDAKAAIRDLDRAVAIDPDPKFRRMRAAAREAGGDAEGAKKDRAHACALGDAESC
jgi:serine/threonine-protein kinase